MPQNKQALTVSLIIPAYNEARHIEACVQAALTQTEPFDEIIVVNNNSSDDTARIVKKFPNIKVINELKQGIYYARNAGFNAATSQIIARIDADTILPAGWNHYIKRFYSDPAHLKCALTGGAYFYNARLKRLLSWFLGQIAFRINRLLMGHYITYGANMALPHQMWDNVKASTCEKLDIHEDLDLSIHLHRAGYQIAYREHHRVGVKMRRVRSNFSALWENLLWWPRTLRHHGKKTWIIGFIGAVLIYLVAPLVRVLEVMARLFGRKPLEE